MKYITTFLFLSFVTIAFTQTDEANLEKYWKFRNNFRKNFVKIGPLNGESIPLNAYRPSYACADHDGMGNFFQSGSLKWGDAPSRIGFYLMMLATEYRLLKDQGRDVTSVLTEIYYALETFNRLDLRAEPYLTNQTIGATLDGYYIRDDVPESFSDNFSEYQGEAYKCVDADFFARNNVDNIHDPDAFLTYQTYLSNNFPSKDQLSGILPGLAFVAKFVDNEFVKPTANDVGFNVVDEAKIISDRYIMYLKNHEWWYNDINSGEEVNNGGGDLILESYPIGIIGNRITGNNYSTPIVHRELKDYKPNLPNILNENIFITENEIENFWNYQIPFFLVNNFIEWECFESLIWQTDLFVICLFEEDVDESINSHNINTLLTWVTYANLWNKNIIHSWVEASGFYYMDLVYSLYNDEIPFGSQNYYKQLLDAMQCEGSYANRLQDGTIVPAPGGWAAENRWIKPIYANTGSPEDGQHGTYSALDYMLYHNLYYLAFKDQLSAFEEKYSCECNDEVIPSNVATLNNQVMVAKKFNDYYEKNIDEMHFLSHDVSVESSGSLLLNTDLTICGGAEITLINNGNITTADASNNRFGDLFVTGNSKIKIDADGQLVVKSGTTAYVKDNSELTINDGGKLIIEDNARLIIEPTASLTFNENGLIELNGNEAVLEIQGNVNIGDNATFTFNGNGFIRWNTQYQPNSNVTAGINSKIKFQGSSRTDKVLEISDQNGSADCWMPDNLSQFILQTGLVEFKTGGRLVLPCPFSLTASNFNTSISPFTNSRGLWVAGQSDMFLSGCNFYNSDIDGKLIYGGNPLKIYSCKFFDNAQVKIDGAGYQLTNTHFTNCGSAIEASDIYMPSLYRNGTMVNCSEAIVNFTSNTTVSLDRVKITSQGGGYAGVYQEEGLLNLKCSEISGDDQGVYLRLSGLNSSIVGNIGGYTKISGINSNIYLDNANFLNLDNGYNLLLPNSSSGKIITGNLGIGCSGNPMIIPANNNKWLTNNSINPNTTGSSQPNNTYPNAYINPTAIGSCDVIFNDNNRGASAQCATFDPNPIGGIAQASVFKSCTNCPMVNGTYFNNVRMNDAVLLAMEKMELIDTTLSDPNKNDFIAIQMFNEIISQPGLNLNDPEIAFLAKFSYQMVKTCVQNCLNTGRLTKANNNPNLHSCSNHYLNILNFLRQPVTAENYKDQFALELDNALIYFWVGRFADAVIYLKQIDNCYLTDEEYRLLNYWIQTIELKNEFVIGNINIDEYDDLFQKLPRIKPAQATNIDPTADIHPTVSVGTGSAIGNSSTVGQNVIIGLNCQIGSNVSIDNDVVIGDNVVIGNNTAILQATSVGSETSIGNSCEIDKEIIVGKNVKIENNVSISKEVKIGDWVNIDDNAMIDKEVKIADGAYIGTNTIINKTSFIGTHSIIRRNSIIEKESVLGNNVIVDYNVSVGLSSKIGNDVIINENISTGNNVKICDASVVVSNIPNNGIIGNCNVPSIPAQPFIVSHDEIFAVSHAHIYGKMENGFKVLPAGNHYFVGQTLTFSANEFGSNISWDFGNCTNVSAPVASYTFTNPGIYVITLKVEPPSGCNNVSSTVYIGSVSIHPKPILTASPIVTNCPSMEPVEYKLVLEPGNTSAPGCMSKYGTYCTYSQLKSELCRLNIHEIFGDGTETFNPYFFSQLIHGVYEEKQYDEDNTYNFEFTGSYEALDLTTENWSQINYETSDKGSVSLINMLHADFVMDEFLCANSSVSIINNTSHTQGLIYEWDLSDGQNSTNEMPVFNLSEPGSYTLTLTITDSINNCSDYKTISFEVGNCQLHSMMDNDSHETNNYFSSNTLSVKLYPNPNSGDFNFSVSGLTVKSDATRLLIYDANGKMILTKFNITNELYNLQLKDLPSGIYHWNIINEGELISNSGNFIILK